MTDQPRHRAPKHRGGAPVGILADLDSIEAASVLYLRLWSDGPDAQAQVWNDFACALGPASGRKAMQSFEELCSLCSRYGRRPLIRHAVQCRCLGADEACFANFVATAATGDREDAMLMATLFVRPDIAPVIASLAAEVGFALKRMHMSAPHALSHSENTLNHTLH